MFIMKFIINNLLKIIFAAGALSILLYFSLLLGPLLGSVIGIFFILIFGEGSYLEFVMRLSTICIFLCFTYGTINLIWSDEIKTYKKRKFY